MSYKLTILAICLLKSYESHSTTPRLTPEHVDVFENESLRLTCSLQGTAFLWTKASGVSSRIECYSNKSVQTFTGFLSEDRHLYKFYCFGNGSFTLEILNVEARQNNQVWKCGNEFEESNNVTIKVKVPVKSVTLKQPNNEYMREHQDQLITCNSSAGRPDPKVKWYLRNPKGNILHNLTQFSSNKIIPGANGLKAVVSTLNFKPNRTTNEWRLYCEVWTQLSEADLMSREIIVYVSYPPKYVQVIQNIDTNSIVSVIESDTGTFVCYITGGNPHASLRWDCFGSTNDSYEIHENNRVTSTINWKANRFQDTCSCTSEHIDNWKRIVNVTFNVQYPPSIPTINISYNNDTIQVHEENVSIIESERIHLTCFSKSKPSPTYAWEGARSTNTHATNLLTFQNISRNETGVYTCKVGNVMIRSFGKIEEGKNKSTINFNVLYPAIIMPIEDRSIAEGSQLSMSCPVINGNPPNFATWSRSTDKKIWNQTLYIQNVSRADDTVYSCSVITEMFPTIGSSSKIERKELFHLNVFYPSEIINFSVLTTSSVKIVVINRTENTSFICVAVANPPSDLSIKDPAGDIVSDVSKQNTARHTIHNASYINAGEYICTGRNNYTSGQPTSSKLILIVKTQPRPSSDDTSVQKVATALHIDAELQFVAWNYLDKQNETVFSWFKENVSIPDNNSKYMVHSNELQTNITIRNTTQQDLGLYKLNVKNSVGTYTHFYELQAKDKPESPRDVRVINDSITDRSVTLTWSPGFNGGFQQFFVIIYRKKNANIWLNKLTKDNGDKIMNYTLYHLTSSTEYEIEMFSKNIKGNSTHTERLQFITKAAFSSETNTQRKHNSIIIAGSISAAVVVVVVVIIGAIFFLRKRQNKSTDSLYQNVPFFGSKGNRKCEPKSETKKKRRNEEETTDETTFGEKTSKREPNYSDEKKKYIRETEDDPFEALQEVDDVPVILNERTEYCNSPDKIENIDRITVAELYAYVFGNNDNLEIEYQKLPTGLQNPCTFARKPENIALNRYNGIYPYDHSRVKISDQPEFFINACYIDGYRKKKAYIASLGPTSKTTNDFKTFWQMVWHERSDMIVMLTNLHEPSGMKCEKYWPNEGTSQQYGDVTITCKTFEAFAEYTVRTFGVSKGKEHRLLTHLHYTAWPDKTVPEDVTSLLDLRKRMQDIPIIQNGPIVIHCSAGIGRTGTLIALDILIEEGLDKQSVNVFECVDNLRKQRVKMVQTLEQYIYIHKCLVNALSFDDETISKERIHENFENKKDQQYSTLFQKLKLTVETDNKSEQKARLTNMKNSTKNRQEADVPGDRFIVFLNLTDGKEGAEYINAVYVNSFKRKDHFIVAQSPLSNTVTDFVSMIFQEDCSCIATMEDLKEPDMTVGTYLPELNKKATFGNFQVSSSKLEEKSAYIIRKIKIKYTNKNADGEKCFYHFQYKNWTTGSKTPGNVAEFVQFISEVEEYANELGEDRSRVVVHCLKANERSCLFCAVAIIIEKLKVEGNVNILNVIRHLRTRRRTAIVSKEQLKFCYEAASAYIKHNRH